MMREFGTHDLIDRSIQPPPFCPHAEREVIRVYTSQSCIPLSIEEIHYNDYDYNNHTYSLLLTEEV